MPENDNPPAGETGGRALEVGLDSVKPTRSGPPSQGRTPHVGGRYPYSPGFKGGHDTGRNAAQVQKARAPTMRERVLAAIEKIGAPATPEMILAHMLDAGERALLTTIRPRCSELFKMGKLMDSGLRAPGEGGQPAIRWQLVRTRRELSRGAQQ